jgi:hypothetical protein
MKDLKQEIQELKNRLATLEGMVDRVESQNEITKDYGITKPQDNNFCIDLIGNVIAGGGCGLLSAYNAFPTREAAEAEAKYTLISRQYRNFAKKLNGDCKADWKDNNDKWGIVYDEGNLEILSWAFLNGSIHQVSFHKKEHAELALKVFGDDLLILCS